MGVESPFDRLGFLNPSEFGVLVYPIRCSGTLEPFYAIFDNEAKRIDFGDSVISTSEPQLYATTTDTQALRTGDLLEVEGMRVSVTDIQPDGTGMTVVLVDRVR